MDLNTIHLGDCLEVLKTLPDESVDSYVSDVPYGLGRDPDPEEILAYLQGEELETGDFKGADWNVPPVTVWEEVYRVLKPGAYLLAFGGSRTFDLISLGIRMAGFKCRDSIFHEFPEVDLPLLQWVTGQGMPKSQNVGLFVDRVLGHKHSAREPLVSTEALKWKDYGTGLKPSCEPILLFRKPFKGTIAANVLKYGTGALNINATRVKHANQEDFEAHKAQVDAVRAKGGVRDGSWKNSSDLSGANEVTAAGRWPANLVMSHSEGCVGEPRQCVEGCPVRVMDEQSGDRPSTLTGRADPNGAHTHPGTALNPNSTFLGERTHLSQVYADSGGASRFFNQFDGVPFRYVAKANRREAGCGEFEVMHPTVKPPGLMRWLVRLVTAPGGIVLDSYCGSGSTLHAAVEEGCQYIGIERDPVSYAEAKRRMDIVHARAAEAASLEEVSNFMSGGE